jgi:hypothetical protein
MTCEVNGVGIFGHVFTRPEDRRKGAFSKLMELQMNHFRGRGGRALFLSTGFDTSPYRIYARHGFKGIEDKSGYMDYYRATREEFESSWFASGPTEVQPLAWVHWPVSAPLFMGDFPGRVRCARLGMIGRCSSEGHLLKLLFEERLPAEGRKPGALVLRSKSGGAVVGFAASGRHPIWSVLCLVDVFCHPSFWDKAGDLLAALELPSQGHLVAYADVGWTAKARVLRRAGFKRTATLSRWAPQDAARTGFADVAVYEKDQ